MRGQNKTGWVLVIHASGTVHVVSSNQQREGCDRHHVQCQKPSHFLCLVQSIKVLPKIVPGTNTASIFN